MIEWFQGLFPALNSGGNILLMIGVGLGTMLFVFGAFDAIRPANPAARRYRKDGVGSRMSTFDAGLLHNPEVDPKGLWKALMPSDKKERSALRRNLINAGFLAESAPLQYFLWRIGLAIALPSLIVAMMFLRQSGFWLPDPIVWFVDKTPRLVILQILTALAALGFFLPAWWVKKKASERIREIEETFPNALDLIQISV